MTFSKIVTIADRVTFLAGRSRRAIARRCRDDFRVETFLNRALLARSLSAAIRHREGHFRDLSRAGLQRTDHLVGTGLVRLEENLGASVGRKTPLLCRGVRAP